MTDEDQRQGGGDNEVEMLAVLEYRKLRQEREAEARWVH